MRLNKGIAAVALACGLFAMGDSFATGAITIPTTNGNAGATVNPIVSFAGDGTVAGFQIVIDTSAFSSASCTDTDFGSSFDSCADIGGGSFRLIVLDASATPLGNGTAANLTLGIPGGASGSLTITVTQEDCSDAGGGPASCSVSNGTVNVTVAAPEYASSPSNGGLIQFGSVQQGNVGNAILNVSNTGTGTLVISNVSITGDAQNIFDVNGADTSFNVNPGANNNVDFTCSPTGLTTPGQNQAQVTVSTNDTSEPSVDYTLDCIVTTPAIPVDVNLSEPAGDPDCSLGGCNFGEIQEGLSSAVKAYTLGNNGASTVSGFTIAVSNANFQQTNTCGSSLGAGATCSISASFTPLNAGPKNATLSVSGGGISPAETSNLTGTGTAAPGDDDDDDDDDGGLLALGPYISGSYFGGASQNGNGFLIEVQGGSVAKGIDGIFIVYWFAYLNGAQIWLVGAQSFSPGATSIEVPMQITSGADFPFDFDPNDVVRQDWGTTAFEFQDDCLSGLAGWAAEGDFAEDYGSGELPVIRITQILDCPTVQ